MPEDEKKERKTSPASMARNGEIHRLFLPGCGFPAVSPRFRRRMRDAPSHGETRVRRRRRRAALSPGAASPSGSRGMGDRLETLSLRAWCGADTGYRLDGTRDGYGGGSAHKNNAAEASKTGSQLLSLHGLCDNLKCMCLISKGIFISDRFHSP
jgi:hypothetical protein